MGWSRTKNYKYNKHKRLGKGSFGIVYEGISNDGEQKVAVKVFNTSFITRPTDELSRKRAEYEWLILNPHENIAKVIAIEAEIGTDKDVLIMELCNQKDLLKALSKNPNGLSDEEFIRVLKHMTAAIKHLRQRNIIHRDIKPENILKHVENDGRVIYKLADFGFARVLEDGTSKFTQCGTAEYAHPKILYNPSGGNQVPVEENVDLWSLGATLYHLATNKLPFLFKNAFEMHRFGVSKQHGVIASTKDDYGNVVSYTELPETCALGTRVRQLVTPILAQLLEADEKLCISYERYFETVENMLTQLNV